MPPKRKACAVRKGNPKKAKVAKTARAVPAAYIATQVSAAQPQPSQPNPAVFPRNVIPSIPAALRVPMEVLMQIVEDIPNWKSALAFSKVHPKYEEAFLDIYMYDPFMATWFKKVDLPHVQEQIRLDVKSLRKTEQDKCLKYLEDKEDWEANKEEIVDKNRDRQERREENNQIMDDFITERLQTMQESYEGSDYDAYDVYEDSDPEIQAHLMQLRKCRGEEEPGDNPNFLEQWGVDCDAICDSVSDDSEEPEWHGTEQGIGLVGSDNSESEREVAYDWQMEDNDKFWNLVHDAPNAFIESAKLGHPGIVTKEYEDYMNKIEEEEMEEFVYKPRRREKRRKIAARRIREGRGVDDLGGTTDDGNDADDES